MRLLSGPCRSRRVGGIKRPIGRACGRRWTRRHRVPRRGQTRWLSAPCLRWRATTTTSRENCGIASPSGFREAEDGSSTTTAAAAGLMVRDVVRTTTTTTILRHLVVPGDDDDERRRRAGGLRSSRGLGPPMASVRSYLPRGVRLCYSLSSQPSSIAFILADSAGQATYYLSRRKACCGIVI